MTNYFNFFGIEESFDIDLSSLRSKYILNSKKYHPDFHTLKSEQEQEQILEMSTLNNEAWKTLSDPVKRIDHLLSIHNIMPEEGKAQVPQEFLMDMMEINESLMELEFEKDQNSLNSVMQKIESIVKELEKEGHTSMSLWNIDKKPEDLERVKDYYLKLKYINRIRERLDTSV